MAINEYFLGAPMFANPSWRGSLFTTKAKPAELLKQYSAVFNTVEGNNTFYGLPSTETVAVWQEIVPDDFRFCFKIPRAISHDAPLDDPGAVGGMNLFLERIQPLQHRVGRILLQLPPAFDGLRFNELARFIERLPQDWKFAVESRHLDYFKQPHESELLAILRQFDVSRCLFDTSTLHTLQSNDPHIRESQRKKPDMPRRTSVTTNQPMIRFVGHNKLPETMPALAWLADTVCNWIAQGREPFVFIHTPDDANAPQFCRVFHQLMCERRNSLLPLPSWPGEGETVLKQQSLF